MGAPCSISAAAFAAMKASREIVLWTPAWDAWVGGVLVGLATLYAFFTIYAVRRRGATIRPFSLVWATMTFPSAITCIVWLQYAPYLARRRRVWPWPTWRASSRWWIWSSSSRSSSGAGASRLTSF